MNNRVTLFHMKFLVILILFSFAADLSFANLEEIEALTGCTDQISCIDYDHGQDSAQTGDTHCHCHDSHVHIAVMIDLTHSSLLSNVPVFKNHTVFESGNTSDYLTQINRPPIA